MRLYPIILLLFFLISCRTDEDQGQPFPQLMEVPEGIILPQEPDDNKFTTERWALGKRLFYDKIMSSDRSLACASCHSQQLAFADNKTFSRGVEERLALVNTPTLTNISYNPYFTLAGGVETLEKQILIPIQEHNEFDFNVVLIVERLKADSSYVDMCERAYSRTPDAFSVTRSIACFERSLLSFGSPYDHYHLKNNENALNEQSLRGQDIFMSQKAGCFNCHSGINFTNYAFENNGLYVQYKDEGRKRLTGLESDDAKFKIPTLRNIEYTAPYMHDGTLKDLESVIRHYESGGKDHKNKSALIRPFKLTEQERSDLVEFLKSLSDEQFIKNPIFKF